MTTPHQRTRAVVQTRALLSALASPSACPRIPKAVRKEARRLLYHYPQDAHLSTAHAHTPEDWGSVAGVREEAAGCDPSLNGAPESSP
jgi:hypothetical protein